ncbi:hypothetical protein SLS56_000350 [Neofusicoccum ribis]|uniref:Phosphatidylethanolamine-binding protein n=1 Tax=Neofusicoccum ribis TaxID=45134 RepID=A0ABR3TE36_9PEZI
MQSRILSFSLLAASALAQTPPNFSPSTDVTLDATFDSNSTTPAFFVNGGVFARNATQTAPQLFLPANTTFANGTQPPTFLILMVDPDAPSPQDNSRGEILHWIQPSARLSRSVESVTGPNGTSLAMLSATDDEAIVPYAGPAPPSVGPHRYIIMLFRQPSADGFELPDQFAQYADGAQRQNFNASAFVAAAGLADPIAATYFLVGNGTTGNGSATYTGDDAAAGIGGNTTSSSGGASASGSASPSGDASETGGSSASGTASGAAATQSSGSGAEKLGVGALVGAVAGAMVLLG